MSYNDTVESTFNIWAAGLHLFSFKIEWINKYSEGSIHIQAVQPSYSIQNQHL